jgi:hypothetical protein
MPEKKSPRKVKIKPVPAWTSDEMDALATVSPEDVEAAIDAEERTPQMRALMKPKPIEESE